MAAVIVPSGVRGEEQTDIGNLSLCMLRGIGSVLLFVDLVETVAGGDDFIGVS